jgi:hypothetical protein
MIYIFCYALCRAPTHLTTAMPKLWLRGGCAAFALVWLSEDNDSRY